jgi:DNA-binding response OmpR family regulator
MGKDIAELLCLRLGATAYVQKPFNFDTFFEAIRAIVNQWLPSDLAH